MWKILVILMFCGGNESQAGPSSHEIEHEIIASQRGKSVLLRAGHKYNKERKNKDGSCTWRCTKRRECKARLIISSNNCIRRDDRHNCVPDFVSNEFEVSFNKCIEEVKNDCTIPIPSAFRQTVSSLKDKGLDIIKKVPEFKNVKNKLYRKRNKALGVKKLCFKSLKEVTVPERFKNFLLADYHTSNRILVFASEHCKTILTNPNWIVLCDGTFKFCLKPFQQLYSLHVDLGGSQTHNNIIPVIYALLANKTKMTYQTLFRLIKSQIPEFNPKTIIVDFEKAAMMAIKDVFPATNISGCYFHFSRSLWRKAEKLGITKSALFRKHIKICIVMAHLPKEAVESGWLFVMSQCPKDDNILKFNDYFVETWLDETSFFADKWSCNNMQHRTNNMVEHWHSIINKKINSKPSNIAHFLTILKQEDDYYQTLYLKKSNITVKLKETCAIDAHVTSTIKEFTKGDIGIGLCIELLIL